MSKAVLMSIKPKFVEMILNRKKTVEVRKTAPKLETPFKCYIYCMKNKDVHDLLEIHKNGKIKKANGKVVAEFTCTKIHKVDNKGSQFIINNDIAQIHAEGNTPPPQEVKNFVFEKWLPRAKKELKKIA